MQSDGPEDSQLTIFQKFPLKSGPFADTPFYVPDTVAESFPPTYKYNKL